MDEERKQDAGKGTTAVAEPVTVDIDAVTAAPEKKKRKIKLKLPSNPKKRKWAKRGITFAVLLAIVAVVFSRCANAGRQAISSAYIPEPVAYRNMTVSVSGTGTVQPADSYKVTALITGEILDDPFEEGDVVEKGALLYQIDAKDVTNSVEQARIQLEQAKLSYSDSVELTTMGAGTVEQLYFKVGDTVTSGAVVADVTQRDIVTLKVPFLKQDAQNMYAGQSCTVTVSGFPDQLSGRVAEVSAADTVDAGGAFVRNVRVEVNNPGGITKDMQGSVNVGGKYSTAMGQFSYGASSQVTARTTGTVLSLVKEGTRVATGQSLGTLGGTSSAANAGLGLEQAELNYQNALDRLDDYTITAPIGGTVVEKVYKTGDKLDSATAAAATGAKGYMAVIFDLSYLEFTMNIDELDINKVFVGQEVEITSDALENKTFTGAVTKVNINGATSNGVTTYPVTIQLDGNGTMLQEEGLKPGMNISAKIIVDQADNVLTIPVDAVERGNTVTVPGAGAMNAAGDGVTDITKIEEKQITLGRNDQEYIEVVDGLADGDIVLVKNQSSNMMQMMMGG